MALAHRGAFVVDVTSALLVMLGGLFGGLTVGLVNWAIGLVLGGR